MALRLWVWAVAQCKRVVPGSVVTELTSSSDAAPDGPIARVSIKCSVCWSDRVFQFSWRSPLTGGGAFSQGLPFLRILSLQKDRESLYTWNTKCSRSATVVKSIMQPGLICIGSIRSYHSCTTRAPVEYHSQKWSALATIEEVKEPATYSPGLGRHAGRNRDVRILRRRTPRQRGRFWPIRLGIQPPT